MPNLIPIFLTGLLTGGVSCMAVQGGLLTAVLTNQKNPINPTNNPIRPIHRNALLPISAFLIAKLLAYTILGFFLGLLGSVFQLTPVTSAIMLSIASFFMIGSALNLLNVHPMFRYIALQPPKFLTKYVRGVSKSGSWFAPAFVGALTIFIPCGTTQAMMAEAISSGKAVSGSLILAAFVLGTIPLFFFIGIAIQTFSQTFSKYFTKVAAAIVIALALYNLYNVASMFNLTDSFQRMTTTIKCEFIYCENTLVIPVDLQDRKVVTTTPIITINESSYTVDNPNIPAGGTIILRVKNVTGAGCIQIFTIPKLGIQKVIPVGKEEDILFTAPDKAGELIFSCSMGMYRGKFIVR